MSGVGGKWAQRDSNPQPRDYAYHHGFHRRFRVRGLDSTFSLRASRRVSTPSGIHKMPDWLGITMSLATAGFTEFGRFYQNAL